MKRRSDRTHDREIRRQLSPWTRRRVAAWGLMGLGIGVAGQHVAAHGGFRPLPLSMGWQDLLTGYPMAILLGVVGAMLLDPRPTR